MKEGRSEGLFIYFWKNLSELPPKDCSHEWWPVSLVHMLINNGYVRATYGLCVIMSVLEHISTLPGLVFISWRDKGLSHCQWTPNPHCFPVSLLFLKLCPLFLAHRTLSSNVEDIPAYFLKIYKEKRENIQHWSNVWKHCVFEIRF